MTELGFLSLKSDETFLPLGSVIVIISLGASCRNYAVIAAVESDNLAL